MRNPSPLWRQVWANLSPSLGNLVALGYSGAEVFQKAKVLFQLLQGHTDSQASNDQYVSRKCLPIRRVLRR